MYGNTTLKVYADSILTLTISDVYTNVNMKWYKHKIEKNF